MKPYYYIPIFMSTHSSSSSGMGIVGFLLGVPFILAVMTFYSALMDAVDDGGYRWILPVAGFIAFLVIYGGLLILLYIHGVEAGAIQPISWLKWASNPTI